MKFSPVGDVGDMQCSDRRADMTGNDSPISEGLLRGLGRGIGFVYFHIKGTDPFHGGRANQERPNEEGLEKTIGRRTGVVVESHTTASAKKAQIALRAMLTDNEPALVCLCMGFLPGGSGWTCLGAPRPLLA